MNQWWWSQRSFAPLQKRLSRTDTCHSIDGAAIFSLLTKLTTGLAWLMAPTSRRFPMAWFTYLEMHGEWQNAKHSRITILVFCLAEMLDMGDQLPLIKSNSETKKYRNVFQEIWLMYIRSYVIYCLDFHVINLIRLEESKKNFILMLTIHVCPNAGPR